MHIYLNLRKEMIDGKLGLLYSNTLNHLTLYERNELRFV